VTNTPTTDTWQADFGMPSSARVRVADLRGLPVTTGVDFMTSGHSCALIQDTVVDRSAMTDAAVKGAFPGTSAWSPPI
jgi:hypothetical protein